MPFNCERVFLLAALYLSLCLPISLTFIVNWYLFHFYPFPFRTKPSKGSLFLNILQNNMEFCKLNKTKRNRREKERWMFFSFSNQHAIVLRRYSVAKKKKKKKKEIATGWAEMRRRECPAWRILWWKKRNVLELHEPKSNLVLS